MKIHLLIFLSLLFMAPKLWAQDNPEVSYQKWVAASQAGDIEALLAVSSDEKVQEYHRDFSTKEQRAEIQKLMRAMAPISYQVKQTKISNDGKRAKLQLDGTARGFFALGDANAQPVKQFIEVLLVWESGQWKVDKQCMGPNGCGKEPDWKPAAYGKLLALGEGASVKVKPGKTHDFKNVPVTHQATVIDLEFTLPKNSETLSYFLHRNPKFADIFLEISGQAYPPVAKRQKFPNLNNSDSETSQVEVLKEETSYSWSGPFSGTGTLSLLFDVPKGSRPKKQPLNLILTYGNQKHTFQVK